MFEYLDKIETYRNGLKSEFQKGQEISKTCLVNLSSLQTFLFNVMNYIRVLPR